MFRVNGYLLDVSFPSSLNGKCSISLRLAGVKRKELTFVGTTEIGLQLVVDRPEKITLRLHPRFATSDSQLPAAFFAVEVEVDDL